MAAPKASVAAGGLSSAANSGTNLLFSSSATEFNFTVPFIPVSQAPAPPPPPPPGLLPSDDATDVGEEDSFLGQTSANPNPPPTFNYFSQVPSSSDPFGSIGQSPLGVTSPPQSGMSVFSKPPVSLPLLPGSQDGPSTFSAALSKSQSFNTPPTSLQGIGSYQMSQQSGPPAAGFSTPPHGTSQQSYNPYRHTTISSRANPYITPPQLQQSQPPTQSIQPSPPVPPTQMYSTPPGSLPPSTLPPQASMSAGALVKAPPNFLQNQYEPLQPHWFYCKEVENKELWMPFSLLDSAALEEVYNSVQPDPENVLLSTDGGRYDVYLYDRVRKAVYWEEEQSEVRRCTWFYKGDTDSRFIPYTEDFSEKLEVEYKKAVTTNQWHRRLEFPGGETIVMHNPKVIVQFQPSAMPDEWGTTQDGQTRPRVVKRGIDEDHEEIPDGEVSQVDHLVFMVHGIGPVCDLRFRSIVECVDDFRTVSLKLLQTHFRKSLEEHKVNRIEFLPVHWHSALHGDATGVDRNIKKITLPTIGRLRHFTNETLLDILFYNSPTYCQTIVDKVGLEMNRLYALFMSRNPDFKGAVSVAGHSLGSLVLFDMLSNQKDWTSTVNSVAPVAPNGIVKDVAEQQMTVDSNPAGSIPSLSNDDHGDHDVEDDIPTLQRTLEMLSLSEYISTFENEKIDAESLLMCTIDDLKEMGIPLGPRKKIANFVKDRAAKQEQKKAALEKKAAMDALIRNQEEAAQATKKVARLAASSAMVMPQDPSKRRLSVGTSVSSAHIDYEYFEVGTGQVSVVYTTLDFEPEIFFALGSPIGIFLTVRGVERIDENYRFPTCKGFFNIYHPLDPVAYRLEPMIIPDLDIKPVLIPHHKGRKRLHLELKESLSRMGSDLKQGFISSLKSAWQTLNDFARAHTSSIQLQAELEKVANQIKEEEEKHETEEKIVESPDFSKDEDLSIKIGLLNGGRRIDYVLQEKPIESFNEYLFALQSHLCYWESEDTALLLLKEIYRTMNIYPEQPQH
ncbi:SEC23-interacting protein isoform X2 [Anolis carolinensis]|uniref:SEC23-interacting protein isoform X2 n=1 Tax=Anolis carolinensis TaxID=28377 RepID=UPI0004629899|nr:PREDICTED: SEC23-interacting protein isoform X2 [Anolis carolinensis]|eukprot:XP_008104997.1 PREDICTED: SEC23-interacting protein isoform X2 [Anolis carolinensis]